MNFFKGKGVVIVFGGRNACTILLQYDAQQFFIKHISKMDKNIHKYNVSFVGE